MAYWSCLVASGTAQKEPLAKPKLSDDFAKAAIKYVVAVQNFEWSATTDSVEKAESRIESAKEDMEASETAFACEEKVAHVAPMACPEHMTSTFLELRGMTHVVLVKAYHLTFKPEDKENLSRSNSCLDAWKIALQRRDDTRPDVCGN